MRNKFRTGDWGAGLKSSDTKPKDVISNSERGYRFQFSLMTDVFRKLKPFRSVTIYTMNGAVIDPDNLRKKGPDGGMDAVAVIRSKSREGALQTRNRVRKALKSVGQ